MERESVHFSHGAVLAPLQPAGHKVRESLSRARSQEPGARNRPEPRAHGGRASALAHFRPLQPETPWGRERGPLRDGARGRGLRRRGGARRGGASGGAPWPCVRLEAPARGRLRLPTYPSAQARQPLSRCGEGLSFVAFLSPATFTSLSICAVRGPLGYLRLRVPYTDLFCRSCCLHRE